MERNWLIRTTQNQILGPVAKAKVIEFLEKGALGTNDEVTSGNGYWFSLKEKDLVEKYLYGDVPQGYNPISESKSVLSKRENPDKTTSLNTAPANKTQVLKASDLTEGVLPKNEDLEYPDITLISTPASPGAHLNPTAQPHDDMKLPNQSDLEFPDITMVRSSSQQTSNDHGGMQTHAVENRPIEIKSRPEMAATPVSSSSVSPEEAAYPEDDDLAYPDMISATPVHKAEAVLHSPEPTPAPKPVAKPVVKTGMRDFKNEVVDDPGLTLVMETVPKEQVVKEEKPEPVISLVKKEKPKEAVQAKAHAHEPVEDKKLLHERKVKASAQTHHKDHHEEPAHEPPPRSMPEDLKKRNDNYLLYILAILVLIIFALFFYYYRTILNKPLPV